MKKFLSILLAAVLVLSATAALADGVTIAVPNDATNEGRALLLLQSNGIITLKEEAGITATVLDIAENPLGIEFVEAEAAMLPNLLADVDYAIINNDYALDAG
ncbi:MAG: MetQ/NlpA family ABC transporter substrate-binding protein, partial [Aristaeellaceae bacterium]